VNVVCDFINTPKLISQDENKKNIISLNCIIRAITD
jgi:hypothetical protein